MNLDRPLAPNPYDLLPSAPSLTVSSNAFTDGAELPLRHSAGDENISPDLSWSGFPAETKSFIVTCFDPDAPTPSGYWHWTVADLSADVTSLPEGAGSGDDSLPGGAFHARTDGGALAYEGAGPPPGDRPHRYIFAVHALDVESLGVSAADSPTKVAFLTLFHTIARGTLTATFAR